MAQPNPEITLQVDATGKDVNIEEKEESTESAVAIPADDSTTVDSVETSVSQDTTTDAQSTAPPPRPSLVPLGSSHGQSSLSTPTAPTAPHPKRFSAVNINKKFLEKNTVTGSSTVASSTSSNMKVGNSASRPSVQATSSHSKLVTAKLTAGPAVSSTPAGWSRSPSVAPSPAPATNSSNSTSPLPSAQSSATTSQSPHIIKGQQQPRTTATQSKESSKPVWGNIKPPAVVPLLGDVQSNDFPTAAEVASVATTRKQAKPDDAKLAPKPQSKQLRSEEADTFRGVHLDPNAHHWDEMEEDDDNFLDGVIEFEDGRQYKVNSSELERPDSSDTQGVPSQGDEKIDPSNPVTKEERFVDDFDRSWPKSKGSPSSSVKEFSSNNPRSASPRPLAGHSPREYPRVLFNERSNRLEPYSHSHRQAQAPGPFGQKRPSLNEGNAPDNRGTREGSNNIQVLRKGTGGDYPRSRRFSSSSAGYSPAPNGFVGPHREGRRDGPPTSPRLPRDQPFPSSEGTFNDKSRRTSMGPPSLPASTSQRGHNRQLPPHLSPETAPRRLSSRDSQLLSPLDVPRSPSFTAAFSGSPAISHASLSPHKTPYASLPGTAMDLEEIRKDVMHNAAERAKARRQLEEEEREAQKERARRKAAELEDRTNTEKPNENENEEASNLPLEEEVNAVLEAAVESVGSPLPPTPLKFQDNTSTAPRRPSIPSRAPITAPSSTPRVESWRRPNAPSSPKQIQSRLPVSDPFSASGPSAVEHVASIADTASDLEVVDFTDMGRFVGVSEPSGTHPEEAHADKTAAVLTKPPRPSASDFFEDSIGQPDPSASAAKSANFGAWRKKVEVPNEAKDEAELALTEETSSETSGAPEDSTTKEPLSYLVSHGQTVHVPVHASPRPILRPQFKEAPMSALDDTMSRIKGAIVGMHTPVTSPGQDSQTKRTSYHNMHTPLRQATGRWVPPAIRVRDSPESPEMFSVTILTRPSTPPLEIPVQLPALSRPLEVVHKKQLFNFNRPPPLARLDILTFEPPILEMKRTWLLNDVLFRISSTFKHNFKYRVVIPKHRGSRHANAKLNVGGAFGRPNIADGVTSWRKPVQSHSPLLKLDESVLETGLDTTTRSPPPEGKTPENVIASIPKPLETLSSKPENTPVRTRQPKMPEGSAVAFMRDSRIDVVEGSPRPLVNFIVGSELEDSWCQTPTVAEPGVTTTSRVVHSPLVTKVELKHEPPKPLSNGSLLTPAGSSKEQTLPVVDGKASNDPVADGLTTPPNHQSPWTRSSLSLPLKESPSRAPDPEHLKAVWSQPSSKTDVKPVNSLKGIADDLTPLPFVLPDAKPGEGTTPSPSLPSAPSRMSIHEVTRAFQQVPTSAANNNQPSRDKVQISPPTTNAPVARPAPANPTATYPYPAPQNNIRPVYAHYPSPMLTHSPAPVMYSHMAPSPVQNRMPNGHPSMYNTWMPAQSSPMMRQSYPPMVPYGSTGFNPPAGTNLMPMGPQAQGAGRPVGMAVISPVLSPAHPYGGSPVLMPQNHGYLSMPPDRVQPLRADNGHMQHPLPSSHSHPSSHSGFNPGPSSPFTRPW